VRLDPTGSLTKVAPVGWSPGDIALSHNAIWVSNTIGDASHPSTDPAQNSVTEVALTSGDATIFRVVQPGPIADGGGAVWVASGPDALVPIASGVVDRGSTVRSAIGTPVFLGSAGDGVVVLASDPVSSAATIARLDTNGGGIVDPLAIGGPAGAPIIAGPDLYLPTREASDWGLNRVESQGLEPIAELPPDTDARSFIAGSSKIGWAFTTSHCIFSFDLASGAIDPMTWRTADSTADLLALAVGKGRVWALTSSGVASFESERANDMP
jgi:hypothetical protein